MARVGARKLLLSAVVLLVGVGGLAAQARAGGDEVNPRSANGIVGSWSVTDPNNPGFHALSTFGEGGTFTVSPAAAATSGGHGAWQRTGRDQFELTFFLYHRNALGVPDHLIRNHENITLSADGDTFHGTGHSEVCDVNGNNCTSSTEERDGSRISVDSAS